MSAQEGEERLLVVFADVHSFFGPPSPHPVAHRFDKGSYLYLYGNKSGNGARLEIANNAGTRYQDAFTGPLDASTIRRSHKQPTLCTVTAQSYHNPYSPPARQPEHFWKLPDISSRHERSHPVSLHTVDIYFWTLQDADQFTSYATRLLQHDQLELLDFPPTPAPHDKVMSPVVQKLENAAIQDPVYHDPKPSSTTGGQVSSGKTESPKATDAAGFQPLAYNPAAPAAPEPIRHREKTPPPDDADVGTGLAAAAYADQAQQSAQSSLPRPPYASTASGGYVGSAPMQPHQAPFGSPAQGGYGNPSSAMGQRTTSAASFPPPSPPPQSPPGAGSADRQQLMPAFGPPPQDPASQQTDTKGGPVQSPGSSVLGGSYVGSPHQPLQHVQPQYADYLGTTGHSSPGPVGGYSNYSYTQQQQSSSPSNQYDVHQQVYRPTEDEFNKHNKKNRSSSATSSQPTGKLEQQAGRVDKGVNRLFKKFEKKIG